MNSQIQDYKAALHAYRMALSASVFMLAIGTVFYHLVEKLAWLDAIYFSVITLATVGYGDIVPHTTAGKIFTIFYVLIGIGIIATFANLTIKRAVAHREIKKSRKSQA